MPRSGQGVSLVARRRQRPNSAGARRRIVPVVATEAPPTLPTIPPVQARPLPAPVRPVPVPLPLAPRPVIAPAAEVTTQGRYSELSKNYLLKSLGFPVFFGRNV